MGRFLIGFSTATALWGAVGLAAWSGAFDGLLGGPAPEPVAAAPAPDAGVEDDEAPSRAGRARRRRARAADEDGRAAAPEGVVTEGDDLTEGPRTLDLAAGGGEAQLPPSAIRAGMDAVFPRIRRCLVLAAGEEPVRGRLVFGLRIGPDGRVSGVELTGPAAVAGGEAGACLREAARAASFPSFDGPPMTARYPLTLE